MMSAMCWSLFQINIELFFKKKKHNMRLVERGWLHDRCIFFYGEKKDKMRKTSLGAFSIYKKIRKFSIGNFRLGKARSICQKSHSGETWPLNRPRKAWNW